MNLTASIVTANDLCHRESGRQCPFTPVELARPGGSRSFLSVSTSHVPPRKATTVAHHATPAAQLLGTKPSRAAHWLELPAEPASVKVARHTVRERLCVWRVPATVRADAALILSELVTNAILHTPSAHILCGIELVSDSHLCVEVHDHGPMIRSLPLYALDLENEHGRGLLLVEQISSGWGVDRSTRTGGNAVWATLPTAL